MKVRQCCRDAMKYRLGKGPDRLQAGNESQLTPKFAFKCADVNRTASPGAARRHSYQDRSCSGFCNGDGSGHKSSRLGGSMNLTTFR